MASMTMRPADTGKLVDRGLKLFGEQVLHPQVQGKLQRCLATGQPGVEGRLHSRNALVVDVGEADHVGDDLAVWIEAALIPLQMEARHTEAIDGRGLPGRQAALDPDEGAIAGQVGAQALTDRIGHDFRQTIRHLYGIAQLRGLA